jgi:hypothetical protein
VNGEYLTPQEKPVDGQQSSRLKEQKDCDAMRGLIPDETGVAIGDTVPVDTPLLVCLVSVEVVILDVS